MDAPTITAGDERPPQAPSVWTTARRMHRLFGRQRGRWVLLSVIVAATSAAEAGAAALVFALVSMLSTGGVSLPVVGLLSVEGGDLGVFAAVVISVFLLRAGLVVLHDTVLYRLCYGAGARLEEQLLLGYLSLPPREVRRRGHAVLVRNVHDTVVTVVEESLVPSVLAVGGVLRTVAVVAVMAAVSPLATLLAGAVFAPALWLVARAVRRPVRRMGQEVDTALAESLRVAGEGLALSGEVVGAGRAQAFSQRFGAVRRRIARAGGGEEVLKAVPRLVAETMLVLFVVAYVAVATVRGDAGEALSTLGLFAYAALRVLPSLIGLVGLVHSIAYSSPAVEIVLADAHLLRSSPPVVPATQPPSEVVLDDVAVVLPETGRTVLSGVDLVLRRGDVVAVVGPNGAGKSTLLDLLAGMLLPSAGEVRADGRRLEDWGTGWSAQVAVVPQHVHLLDADVAANVALDPSGASSQDPRVAEVVEQVGLRHVVERLGGRAVGEDGRALSGGERQKVAVARALVRRAGVLLVDEGTSALDAASRASVADLVAAGAPDRLTVVVTHDPALAEVCTRVVRVEAGRVVEETAAGARAG
ncbi:ABC transporter ATP-binding protein [uncultured Pseudokineococcus sp.]|uniref:ATP-binding cassette domain-containing protein n=1 Tax=uncultured Pseudokineococcus sp. TaxID=1642928 RepID=UPI002602FE22|nr:ABC transporter ATP-binding protein [uncultured Pseudokineococcus sp.]